MSSSSARVCRSAVEAAGPQVLEDLAVDAAGRQAHRAQIVAGQLRLDVAPAPLVAVQPLADQPVVGRHAQHEARRTRWTRQGSTTISLGRALFCFSASNLPPSCRTSSTEVAIRLADVKPVQHLDRVALRKIVQQQRKVERRRRVRAERHRRR